MHYGTGLTGKLNKLYPAFAARSLLLTGQTVFLSPELDNCRLVPGFPWSSAASALPADISASLRLNKRTKPYLGAYPPGN